MSTNILIKNITLYIRWIKKINIKDSNLYLYILRLNYFLQNENILIAIISCGRTKFIK